MLNEKARKELGKCCRPCSCRLLRLNKKCAGSWGRRRRHREDQCCTGVCRNVCFQKGGAAPPLLSLRIDMESLLSWRDATWRRFQYISYSDPMLYVKTTGIRDEHGPLEISILIRVLLRSGKKIHIPYNMLHLQSCSSHSSQFLTFLIFEFIFQILQFCWIYFHVIGCGCSSCLV